MKKLAVLILALLAAPPVAAAQSPAAWDNFDFAHRRIDSAQIATLPVSTLRALRGIVFGRHGRPFTDEPDVQAYLKSRSWYRADSKFSNASLSAMEKANIDVIRRAEMTKHPQIDTGDVRYLKDRPITVKMLGHHTAPDWEVLQAEISATHGPPSRAMTILAATTTTSVRFRGTSMSGTGIIATRSTMRRCSPRSSARTSTRSPSPGCAISD